MSLTQLAEASVVQIVQELSHHVHHCVNVLAFEHQVVAAMMPLLQRESVSRIALCAPWWGAKMKELNTSQQTTQTIVLE